jgi:RNA polymerase sigma-70 factor (ECF subfamily)
MTDSDPRTDAELLLATSEDVEAFGVFYRRHVDWVVGLLAARSGNAELAADLTSEVFAAALLASRRFDPARGAANSWLYGIVAHKLASAGRRGEARAPPAIRAAHTSSHGTWMRWQVAVACSDARTGQATGLA